MVQTLPPKDLAHRCDPGSLGFASTDALAPLEGVVGQSRAEEAITLALGMERDDFNLFVMGPTGTARHTLVERLARERAGGRPRASDWVYVHNFSQPHKPVAIELPAGRGTELRHDMAQLIEDLSATVPERLLAERGIPGTPRARVFRARRGGARTGRRAGAHARRFLLCAGAQQRSHGRGGVQRAARG